MLVSATRGCKRFTSLSDLLPPNIFERNVQPIVQGVKGNQENINAFKNAISGRRIAKTKNFNPMYASHSSSAKDDAMKPLGNFGKEFDSSAKEFDNTGSDFDKIVKQFNKGLLK